MRTAGNEHTPVDLPTPVPPPTGERYRKGRDPRVPTTAAPAQRDIVEGQHLARGGHPPPSMYRLDHRLEERRRRQGEFVPPVGIRRL